MQAQVTLPDGQVVRLNGYADRLELDEDGRVVVIDLKTGKYPPTGPQVERHSQLGLYQLAVEHGAADEWLAEPDRPPPRAEPSWCSRATAPTSPRCSDRPPAAGGSGLRGGPARGWPRRRCAARSSWPVPVRTATGARSTPSCPDKSSGSVLS